MHSRLRQDKQNSIPEKILDRQRTRQNDRLTTTSCNLLHHRVWSHSFSIGVVAFPFCPNNPVRAPSCLLSLIGKPPPKASVTASSGNASNCALAFLFIFASGATGTMLFTSAADGHLASFPTGVEIAIVSVPRQGAIRGSMVGGAAVTG